MIAIQLRQTAQRTFMEQELPTLLIPRFLEAARKGDINTVTKLLKNKGVSVNAADQDGYTALHWAALHNRPKVAEKLLSAGADVNLVSKSGHTPLYIAADYNHRKVKELILDKLGLLGVVEVLVDTIPR